MEANVGYYRCSEKFTERKNFFPAASILKSSAHKPANNKQTQLRSEI
jgi:hypothetical protein